MKNTFLPWLAVMVILIALPYCKKKSSDSCGSETSLAVSTTPATGTTEAPAPGPTFPLKVSITSAIPASGVTIEVKARPDGASTTFFSEQRSSSTKDNDFTITGAPATVVCLVEISVTSKTCGTNKWTGSYRFSKK